MGSCLPGIYVLTYTATNSGGKSSSASLVVGVEELSVQRIAYKFVGPKGREDYQGAAELAAQLAANNATLLDTMVVPKHLASAYNISAAAGLRVVSVNVLSSTVENMTQETNTTAGVFVVAVELNVTLVGGVRSPAAA